MHLHRPKKRHQQTPPSPHSSPTSSTSYLLLDCQLAIPYAHLYNSSRSFYISVMSSQKDAGISLTHAPDGVGYKILELPPELLAILESDDPPVMSLESSTNSAVLKTGAHSWSLRQKNTSNALILLSPSEKMTPTTTAASSPSQIPEAELKAIATIHDTIELVSEPTGKTAPVARGKWHEKFARGR
ncbi:hypothetical protein F4810DRAFT_672846 [Camillea tinctor]|nr:hypothetical protein F4810DRAFT_672846 [Camillea tinctor]